MENSSLLTLVMPMVLGCIMFGLGLSLTPDDFYRVARYPKAVAVGLFCQMLLLPLLCWLLAIGFGLTPALAVGLLLLSASPGGATANLYSHLSNGDVALNITLTALNSLLSLFTLPLIVNLSLAWFLSSDEEVAMQFGKVIEVFAIVLVPVGIGMLIRRRAPGFAARMNTPLKIASALLLLLVIIVAVYRERANLWQYLQIAGAAVIAFNLLSMLTGYFVPQWLGIGRRQAIAIGMEIGLHNATLAIYIALGALKNSQMAIPAAIYGILMFATAAVFGVLVSRNKVLEEEVLLGEGVG